MTSYDPATSKIIALYHPRRDNWHDHFRLSNAQFMPLTPTGRVTIRLLQLSNPSRIEERILLIKAGIFKIPHK